MAEVLATKDLHELAGLTRILRTLPNHRMDIHYDAEADVLYVKFADSKPIHKSKLTKDHFLIEYDAKGKIVGVTILDASTR